MLHPERQQLHLTRDDRTEMLFTQGYSAVVGGLAAALGVYLVMQARAPHPLLLPWVICALAASAGRLVLVNRYQKAAPAASTREVWARRYFFSALFAGSSWGALCFVPVNSPSLLVHSLPILAIAFAAMAVLPAYAPRLRCYAALLGTMTGVASLAQFVNSDPDQLMLICYFLILAAVLWLTALRVHQRIIETLLLRYENHKLLVNARAANHALESANQELLIKQDVIDEELEIAKHVFEELTITAEKRPREVTCWNQPMASFSGDLILAMQADTGDGYAFLGDFTGHGLPAALGALPASLVFSAMASKGLPLEAIAGELNTKLNRLLPSGYFCCCILFQFSPEKRRVRLLNAGLPAALVVSAAGEIRHEIPSTYLPFGIVPVSEETTYVCREFQVADNDCCYLYSDGITDSPNRNQERWGVKRLEQTLQIPLVGCTRLNALQDALGTFRNGAHATDDMSILEYRVPGH